HRLAHIVSELGSAHSSIWVITVRGAPVMKILLADGNQDLVELLSYALRRAGFTTIAATDPATTLKLLKEKQPDLVILEVELGTWNGLDVLRSIRRFSDVPIVMLTARNSEDDLVL